MFRTIYSRMIQLIVSLCILSPISAHAHLISITPTTPFPETVNASTTCQALYTIQNMTSKASLTIVDKSQFPSGMSISSSTCGNPIGPGQTCQIALQYVASSTAQTISTELKEWAKPSADGVQSPIVINVTTSQSLAAAAVGGDTTNNQALITASTDGGSTWAVKPFANNQTDSHFNAVSCLGDNTTGICIAAGNKTLATTALLLVASTDGGNTWTRQTLPVNAGILYGASCIGSGTTATCLAVGLQHPDLPLIFASTNGTSTWTAIQPVSDNGFLNAASCTGSTTNPVCIAAGQDDTTSAPLLVVSTNPANTWNTATVPGLTNDGVFNATSCTGSGTSAICIAAGQDSNTTQPPILVISNNGATTWSLVTVPALTTSGIYNGASCTGSGNTAICVAAGEDLNTSLPLLVASTNGGSTWTNVAVTLPNSDLGVFNGASCTGAGSDAICVAAGQDSTTNLPLIVTSTNGGVTWSVITISNFTDNAVINSTSCSGSVCIAAGKDNTLNQPLLIQSVDGAKTWSVVTIPGIPQGEFYGAATTSLALGKWTHKNFGMKMILRNFAYAI